MRAQNEKSPAGHPPITGKEGSSMTIQVGFVPRGRNVMTIRVTSYRDSCLKGVLSGAQMEGERVFSSAIELLLLIEHMMDQTNTPQRNEEPRSFPTAFMPAVPGAGNRPGGQAGTETLAVFQLNVMFRQNATWQGSLLWVDQGQEAHFRSVLEMLRLLHGVLSGLQAEG